MKKADIAVGVEYHTAQGRDYLYSQRRVRVEAIGAHSNSRRSIEWEAQRKLGYREKVEAYRNDPDLSPNQVKAAIAALDVKVDELAEKLYTPYRIDGKGSDVLCVVLDAKTGEPEMERVYDRKTGEYVETGEPERKLIPTREFRSTWREHVKDLEERQRYAQERRVEAEKREAQKARELQALKAALPEGVELGSSPHGDSIGIDYRPFSSGVEVAMSRATLAKLLGIELPEPPKEEETD